MTAYVNILVAQRQDVLLAPNAALRFRPAEAMPRNDKMDPNLLAVPSNPTSTQTLADFGRMLQAYQVPVTALRIAPVRGLTCALSHARCT